MKKNEVRLYNAMFPIWFLFLFPTLWLVIIPANFIIDTLVLCLTLKCMKHPSPKAVWKKKILPVWIFGFAADMVGAGLVVGLYALLTELFPQSSLGADLVFFPGTTLIAIPGVIVAGVLIYLLNKMITFRKTDLTVPQVNRVCLMLALWTAPYTMLIPLYFQ